LQGSEVKTGASSHFLCGKAIFGKTGGEKMSKKIEIAIFCITK
jgi:hypothetical protein